MIKPDGSPGLRRERFNTKLVWRQPNAENDRLPLLARGKRRERPLASQNPHATQCGTAHGGHIGAKQHLENAAHDKQPDQRER
jgi:hypothetical protein